jgi:hypothetical protein
MTTWNTVTYTITARLLPDGDSEIKLYRRGAPECIATFTQPLTDNDLTPESEIGRALQEYRNTPQTAREHDLFQVLTWTEIDRMPQSKGIPDGR